jgi:subtilisin family serine protease
MINKIYVSFLLALLNVACYSQSTNDLLQDWYLKDPTEQPYNGISIKQAYDLVAKKNPQTITVAVIDAGTEVTHEDLKDKIWINKDEIPNNEIDDDKNGYVDDINGWNFIGGKQGEVKADNLEVTRLYKLGKDKLPTQYKWEEIESDYQKQLKEANRSKKYIDKIYKVLEDAEKKYHKKDISADELKTIKAKGFLTKQVKKSFVGAMRRGVTFDQLLANISEAKKQTDNDVDFNLNINFNPRNIVGDNINDLNERSYGNNNVAGPDPLHGTHVAGIIGASRGNNIGMDGVAENVEIMVVRVVPNGDEQDKDVANAIRYAVDNGAKIINMSFGKAYSPNKEIVDQAVLYAESKNVLLVHGSGNESNNTDLIPSFPNPRTSNEKKAGNWIEVGASNFSGGATQFSNYGQKTVDVFAPGYEIYSTLPNNNYGFENGTSMASPVVAGIAALVWSYYPMLTAFEIKEAILKSAESKDKMVPTPGNPKKEINFNQLSVTGGIVNAAKAIQAADRMVKK